MINLELWFWKAQGLHQYGHVAFDLIGTGHMKGPMEKAIFSMTTLSLMVKRQPSAMQGHVQCLPTFPEVQAGLWGWVTGEAELERAVEAFCLLAESYVPHSGSELQLLSRTTSESGIRVKNTSSTPPLLHPRRFHVFNLWSSLQDPFKSSARDEAL